MKKRTLALLLGLLLALSLTACGSEPAPAAPSDDDTQQEEVNDPEDTQEPEESVQENTFDLGDYVVTIDGASLATDYDGNPALILTYTWTNNSEETCSAMTALMEKAFQDGIQLESAIIGNSSVFDSDASWKEIRPGASLSVQKAFVLDNTVSSVEIEISEFLSFSSNAPTALYVIDLSNLY